MNRDIDIREHAVIIKFDYGHEEVASEEIDLGEKVLKQNMGIVIQKDRNNKIVRVKIQNL